MSVINPFAKSTFQFLGNDAILLFAKIVQIVSLSVCGKPVTRDGDIWIFLYLLYLVGKRICKMI